jgi:ABC-type Fe3+/spermidine/putrescine transport system ATPase subunit/ABC-type sulfate transport system permease component
MKRTAARPLWWLAALLAVYLCAPFLASIPQVGAADWHGVDWTSTLSAVAVSAGSASVASLVILLGGVPLGYLLARSNSRKAALLGFIVQLPLALPPLTSGVLLLFLLGPYSWVGQLTGGALTDSFAGIVLAETFVAAPFLIIAARSAFAAVDPLFEDVAATLGHHPYSLPVYTYIVFGGQGLPAMMPLLLPTLAIAVACAALSIYSRHGRASLSSDLVNGDDADDNATARPALDEDDRRLSIVLKKHLGSFDLDIEWAPRTRRLAIIGTSGSGKSLTLRLIAGLEAGQTATVTLGGRQLDVLPPEERRIGYMPQDYGLFPHMTVARQLAFPLSADAASARQWVDQLGLSTLLHRLPHELSFGQRQRVALARALTQHSQLLLFDEPFAALDTPRRRRLQQSLRTLQREISAVTVIVTHDPDEAALLADEVLLLEHGRVLQAGPVSDVFERPASMRVAELLGLHNVGQGRVLEANKIELGGELRMDMASNTAIPVGHTVMWRLPALAIMPSDEGAFQGMVDGIELRRGDRYARLKICGVAFDIPSDNARLKTGTSHRFSVDIDKLTIWSI